MALSPIPFCPCDGHQTGLWYLPARWRDTTESAQGLLPAWAGSPLAGRVSRPLDGKQSFMKASPPPIPFDQQSLVALNCLYSEGTSLTLICAKGTVAMGWR